MLKDTPCSMKVFDVLRQMNAVRQIEAADLMIGQHNFTLMFARAIRAATPHSQLVAAKKLTGEFCGSWKLYWPDGTPLRHDECPMAMTLD
ncbi:plasmid partitioning protein RepB C-terminal domain-containing protein [Sinorhizobium meliloti]|uniref:plasmid partitioning protein RepB C-terminal domain-containing protein n=1 Tax=Rhizobium meliloti TaxID=382 RepID=UPI003D661B7B